MTEDQARSKKRFRKLLFLPYFVGLLWTCLHPIVSVLTGELKCRGWFLDENAIETRFSSQQPEQTTTITLPKGTKSSKLCDVLPTNRTNLVCYTHGDSFDLAMIVPISNAIDPTDEAIVFVVPAPQGNNWSSSTFHFSLAKLMTGLADPLATPWLAKTLILVSPTSSPSSDHSSLEETVTRFLDAYLGSKSVASGIPPLPPSLSKAILRNLIVLDVQDTSFTTSNRRQGSGKGQTDFSILPQGKRGSLPNMDLVTLIGKLFEKASFMNAKAYPGSSFLAHGYTQQSKAVKTYINSIAPQEVPNSPIGKVKAWAKDMANLSLFAYTMAAGPYPPHWPALDRGIDSVSIQVKFQGTYWRNPSLETTQILENAIRALSNLHERLHHSFVVYLLPSPDKFVSHMEYFLPTVLIMLPLAVRAFGMIIIGEIKMLHLATVGSSVLVTLITMGVMLLSSAVMSDDIASTNTWMLLYYASVAFVWKNKFLLPASANENEKKSSRRQSLQFAACATAAYIFVPIAFAHASLVYVPSMVLVPLLAFPSYGVKKSSPSKKVLLIGLWILVAPPILLVPRFFDSYTTFVRYGYVPLHVQSMLLLLSFIGS
jgi:glycosylphosphatidylinositol transamidase